MPKECFLSVRMGEMQKISRLQPTRIYRFPKGAQRRQSKIEVFQRIGTCTLDLDVTDPFPHQVTINCEREGFGTLGMKVIATQESKPEEATDPKATNRVKAAKDYLAKHGLEVKLSDAMQAVLRERPDDPAAFTASLLMPNNPTLLTAPAPLQTSEQKATRNVRLQPSVDLLPFKEYYAKHSQSCSPEFFAKLYTKFPVARSHPSTSSFAPQPKARISSKTVFPLKPSVGTWLQTRLPEDTASLRPSLRTGLQTCLSEAIMSPSRDAAAFCLRPSVGTWLQPRLPEAFHSQPLRVSRQPPEEVVHTSEATFKYRPSVGSWLVHRQAGS